MGDQLKTEEYIALTPFERAVIDALAKIHNDLILIEGQLIELGKIDVGEVTQ